MTIDESIFPFAVPDVRRESIWAERCALHPSDGRDTVKPRLFAQTREAAMVGLRALALMMPMAAGLLITAAAQGAEVPFAFKESFRNVTKDPEGIWSDRDLSVSTNGHVSIFEYELETPHGGWLISQIWNDDCSAATCPTRLVSIDKNGRKTVLVDDMMHQVVPPDDPRFAHLAESREQAAFAQHPFSLASDGKTLVNGDYHFKIGPKR